MNRNLKGLSVLILIAGAWTGSASALPINPKVSIKSFRRLPAQRPLFNAGQAGNLRTRAINFEGIVALDNCSGSLVRYEGSRDDDQAMVLTNGHCHEDGMPKPGTFIMNEPSSREFAVLDPTSGRSLGEIQAEKIIYGTMEKTDLMLYRTTSTFRQIMERFHVRPLTLSSKQAAIGQKIEIVSGYWRRGYACAIEYFVNTMKEGGYQWRNSIRYTRPGCEVIHGTSGSPIVAAGSDQVIGINNTGNDDGQKCTDNNPCEIDKDGKIIYEKGVSYGQQIALIYSCLDKEMRFDVKAPTCRLPGGPQAGTDTFRIRARKVRATVH